MLYVSCFPMSKNFVRVHSIKGSKRQFVIIVFLLALGFVNCKALGRLTALRGCWIVWIIFIMLGIIILLVKSTIEYSKASPDLTFPNTSSTSQNFGISPGQHDHHS